MEPNEHFKVLPSALWSEASGLGIITKIILIIPHFNGLECLGREMVFDSLHLHGWEGPNQVAFIWDT